ncbi:MAG: zinc-finger domain-containing protein [Rhodospirillales bacterium]|nr:zinc-finger domain-containing protein [Rhodospirillales bacterium]
MTATPLETIEITSETVACDGGGGALGHPKVYLNLGDKDHIDCPYCGRQFKLKPGAKRGGGH